MTLHPQARAALALWAAADLPPRHDIEGRRAAERAAVLGQPVEAVARVEDVDADGVPCRLYVPAGARRAVLYAHGGGFVLGDLETHDAQVRRIANRTGSAVLAVDYRRPPEHPFPAAPDDVRRAGAWLSAQDLGPLVAMGDSAGGNLALVAALRDPGRYAAVVAVYPFLDPTCAEPSYAKDDGGMSREDGLFFWRQYAGDPADPDLAPLASASLRDLPPTLVQAAGEDVLLDEDLALAAAIARAGGEVTLRVFPGLVHGFWRQPGLFDDAERSLTEITAWLDALEVDAQGLDAQG